LIDAQHALVGKAEGGAAAQAGAQTVAGVQELIGAGWGPRRGARGGNLDFAFDGQQNRFGFVRAFRGRGLGAQIAPQQEREKKPPDSWKQGTHEDLFQHHCLFTASKSAILINNSEKTLSLSTTSANAASPEKGYRQIGINQGVGGGFSLRKLRNTNAFPVR